MIVFTFLCEFFSDFIIFYKKKYWKTDYCHTVFRGHHLLQKLRTRIPSSRCFFSKYADIYVTFVPKQVSQFPSITEYFWDLTAGLLLQAAQNGKGVRGRCLT